MEVTVQAHPLSANTRNGDSDSQAFFIGGYMKKLIYGVGVNDSKTPISIYERINGKAIRVWLCPIYVMWRNMLNRCYSMEAQEKHPTYKGCSVSKEWHRFSTFRDWVESNEWHGKEIDKDILYPGNKIYSPETCVFIEAKINAFLTDHGAARGEWPIGVSYEKDCAKYKSSCSNPFSGRLENLGRYKTPAQAHEAWRKRKNQHACKYADMQSDERISAALSSRYIHGTEFI